MSAVAATPVNAVLQPRPCRGDAMMISSQPDERAEHRRLVLVSAMIRLHPDDQQTHVGFIRDVSDHGLFLFTDTKPEAGSAIAFAFRLAKAPGPPIVVSGTGEVVRVVEPAQGAAIGVAVRVVAPLNIQTATATAGQV